MLLPIKTFCSALAASLASFFACLILIGDAPLLSAACDLPGHEVEDEKIDREDVEDSSGEHTPVTLWNTDDLSIVNELECSDWVNDLTFSRDGTRLVVAGSTRVLAADKFVDIWAVP